VFAAAGPALHAACHGQGVRIGERPNLTLWLYREAEYIQQYSPALLPPCPCASGPREDVCELTVRSADPVQADAPTRPEESHDPPRAQPAVAEAVPAEHAPDAPAPESTDAPLAPAWTAGPGAIGVPTGNLLDVFA
jgi:hypothetical protein